jgi:hypothetical protein
MDTRRRATATADREVRPALGTAPRHPAPYGSSALGPNEPLKAPGGLPKPPEGGPKPPVGGVVPTAGGLNSDDGGLEPTGGVKPPAGGARLVGGVAPTGVLELDPPADELLHRCVKGTISCQCYESSCKTWQSKRMQSLLTFPRRRMIQSLEQMSRASVERS